jgi:hypothetical protein
VLGPVNAASAFWGGLPREDGHIAPIAVPQINRRKRSEADMAPASLACPSVAPDPKPT